MTLTAATGPAPAPDTAVRPQDDFHRYANGRWADTFELPAHSAETTLLTQLAEKVQHDVIEVIRRAAAAPHGEDDATGRRIADLYASFMDEERIESLGADALAPDLAAIAEAPDHAALAHVMGRLQAQGVGGALGVSVTTDTADAQGYVLNLTQSGLGLPAPGLYRLPDAAALRERYAAHLRAVLTHVGHPAPDTAAAEVLRLESDLAAGHARPDRSGLVSAPSHACTVAELAARPGAFPWRQWLAGLGDLPPDAAVRVRPAGWLDVLDHWWGTHRPEALKAWLSWMYAHEMAPFGHRELFAENFDFYGRALTGSTTSRPRWMRAVSFVQTVLGDEVGERYLREHLAPDTVREAGRLVTALTAAYRDRLTRADWMRPRTRAAALDKLDRMVFEIGSPRTAAAAEGPRTDPADLIGNVKRGRARQLARQLARLGGPVDRSDWKVPPQAATAYYRHGLNQVVVPAALLQPPLFEAGGDAARNFALLGSIVCHEMSHAFDRRGAHYDGQGRIRDWWDPEDLAEFTRRTRILVEQYGRYEPDGPGGPRVSGERTLGENIADITGLAVAQEAFAAHLADLAAGPAEQAAQMRRFFLLWASMWQVKRVRGRLLERLATDRHAPSEYRCNGALGHIQAFYDVFDVQPADGLHIDPEARFTLV
ncbi:M13 family metallopeptidase [Streptomyces sp. NBC_00503]|uniref:M13 family metallopeptidase n=1 Tax=Streptomyces sp. NBC_00503 TaxID=2903659 RepID=UPI002E811AEC|nr:M13 family metallopeptidase [Streptomyces sp. NBC_00503]WUD86396.1 M13 family metallopeptidase [Streptomyces sp. NBC_00503]